MDDKNHMFSDQACRMNKKETIAIIRSLLSSTNSIYGIYALNRDFKEETGIDIPLFGYDSLSEFLESIPDTVKLTGLFPIQKVSLVNNDASAHIVSLVKRQRRDKKSKKGMGVSSGGYFSIKNNRHRYSKYNTINDKKSDAIQNRPPNLVQSKILPPKKNCLFLNKNFYKNSDDQETKKDMKLDFRQEKVAGNKNYFKHKKCASIRNQTSKFNETGLQDCSQEVGSVDSNPLLRIFECFAQSDEKIPSNDLKLHARVGHYVEVYPCEISHPGLFYLHFREFKNKLKRFMDELHEFYDEHEEIPKLSEMPKQDQVCAVCYSRHGDVARWHRVQVEEILSDRLVLVRLVDYGMSAKILVKNLKLLHRDFISFPKQAVLGSLANIRPPGGCLEWSKSATRRFYELAFCRDLVGGVVSINCDDYSLSVALSSTVGEEIHVNDTLVEEGLAEFDVDVTNEMEKERSVSSIKESDIPSLLYFSERSHGNRRLQKMFTEDG